jgi:hypothetical protein
MKARELINQLEKQLILFPDLEVTIMHPVNGKEITDFGVISKLKDIQPEKPTVYGDIESLCIMCYNVPK